VDVRKALRREKVSSIGHRELVAVGIGASVGEAVAAMRERRVGCVCVLEGERLAGIFTERDLVVRVLGRVSMADPIRAHMTRDPVTVRADDPIHVLLARLQAGGFRHLPVMDARGRPDGTVSVERTVHFLADLMPRTILNLPPDPEAFPATEEGG
jgi:CBS domain-containing protein